MFLYPSEDVDLISAYRKAESSKAFQSFLGEIAQNSYAILRDAVNKLATADCLLSLAHVALQANYVRPEFTDDNMIEIIDGRHPMVEALSSDPYVPNSITMGDGEARSKIITGPNMGGSVFSFEPIFSSLTYSLSAKVVVSG
jgi:DNA mismatch repair protein MSH3